jgi:tetratricopeptide (TPR) repeat protein
VLGREVPLAVLADGLWAQGRLVDHLRVLVRLEFLHEQEHGTYAFKHVLTQEVAYGRLSPPDRERLHAAAGRAYERLYAGRLHEAYDRLAHHFARTREHPAAIDYLTRLAERATRGYALEEALAALQEALNHAEALPEGEPRDRAIVQGLLEEGFPLMLLGRYAEVPRRLTPRASLVERVGDGAARARYHFLLAFAYSHLGDRRRAAAAGHRALEEASRHGDRVAIGRSHMARSLECFWTGCFREGVTHGGQATAHLEESLDWSLGFAAWCLGLNAIALGDLELALTAARRTQEIGQTMGDRRHRSFGSWLAGWALALQGDTSAAIAMCEDALASVTDPVSQAVASQWLGYSQLEAGAAGHAVPLLEQAVDAFRTFRFTALEGWAAAWLGDALTLTGECHAASQRATDAIGLAERVQVPFGLGLAQRALGRALLGRGDLADAAVALTRARERFAAMEARYELARTCLDLATVASRLGDASGVAAHLSSAHDAFRKLSVPSWVERTEQLAHDAGVALAVGTIGIDATPRATMRDARDG